MRKPLCILLCAVLLLAGCRRPSVRIIRFDLPGAVISLDPQFTTEPAARMILRNTGEGLLRRGENNTLEPGVAERWEISPDGTSYRFFLRRDAFWQNGEPVTAADFAFALRRLFQPGGLSPHAEDFGMISGAGALLSGESGVWRLEVYARGERELEIRLEHPSPLFLDLLATPAALPCNEAFFEECRGRYGYEQRFTLSNGPFLVESWENDVMIKLRPNGQSTSQPVCGGVNLYPERKTAPLENLKKSSSDAAFLSLAEASELSETDFDLFERSGTVWCIVPNRNAAYWGNSLLHQGLALAADREKLELPARLEAFGALVPPPSRLAGELFRALVPAHEVAQKPDLIRAKNLFEMGKQAVPGGDLPAAAFYVPDDQDVSLAAGNLAQRWQNELSAYVTLRREPLETVQKRLNGSDFDLLLLPFSPTDPRADSMLETFRSGNSFGYDNPLYDELLDSARAAATLDEAAERYSAAESLLLRDAVIIPLFIEKTVFATASNLNGLAPAAFLEDVDFRYAGA